MDSLERLAIGAIDIQGTGWGPALVALGRGEASL